jgi:16S rRNA (cytidine1402-2'-O)-methyltransferase
MRGNVYLIPVTLGNDDFSKVIPSQVTDLTRSLRYFIVEDLRSARRYLRLIDKQFPINDCIFFVLNEHTVDDELNTFLEPAEKGFDIGLMSEAGLPGIADPGAKITSLAHIKGIRVRPLTGPSSILLALIASGLNGQNFTFNGYLPVKPTERNQRLKELEKQSARGFSQIFIETPYRSQKLLLSILELCHAETKLCVAIDITLESESVLTKRIKDWKKNIPHIEDKLVVFILQ